ncbi:MAG TPA: folylpolyglutamate synthase/dihydrofolate synthase family protein, partial [Anaerolineales bacterium]|nr:folylpolyglutamate synthase/dihydrofolate synthase family protein [Anaerolineales bacterium]
MTSLTYPEALDYLYSFVDYSLERSYRYSAEVFDLARVRTLLARLGDPHEQFASAHVAGTKGKGSVSALTASALSAAGYRTGLYTSPHLQRFTERIRIGNEEIPEDQVGRLVGEMRPHVEAVPGLTTFELTTALAFMYFAQQKVDAAVVEVGLGGRLDATNVLLPRLSIITSLSYDHMHLLGDTLSEIASEKAGIIKPGVPVILAPQQREAELVVEETAERQKARLIKIGKDWLYAPGGHDLEGQSLYIWSTAEQPLMDAFVESAGGEEWVPPRYEIPLLGYHQVVNAAVAYAGLRLLRDQGMAVSETAIQSGFRNVEWRGRFQVLSRSPAVVVDSAHNRDSALKLRIALDDYFPGQPVTLVFGASSDKDIAGMMEELLPRVSRLIVTQAVHPRAADPEGLSALARGHGVRVEVRSPVEEALRYAIERARPGEVIVSAGSLFVAGEVLAAWPRVQSGLLQTEARP